MGLFGGGNTTTTTSTNTTNEIGVTVNPLNTITIDNDGLGVGLQNFGRSLEGISGGLTADFNAAIRSGSGAFVQGTGEISKSLLSSSSNLAFAALGGVGLWLIFKSGKG